MEVSGCIGRGNSSTSQILCAVLVSTSQAVKVEKVQRRAMRMIRCMEQLLNQKTLKGVRRSKNRSGRVPAGRSGRRRPLQAFLVEGDLRGDVSSPCSQTLSAGVGPPGSPAQTSALQVAASWRPRGCPHLGNARADAQLEHRCPLQRDAMGTRKR